MKIGKPGIAIAAALCAAAVWAGTNAGDLPVVREARAGGRESSCPCNHHDLACLMQCALHPRRFRRPVPRPVQAQAAVVAPALALTDGPLQAVISRAASGPPQLVVRRPGHVVALLQGSHRHVGSNSATLNLDGTPEEIHWETSRPGTFALERGTARMAEENGTLVAKLFILPPPLPVTVEKRHLHTCASYRDTGAGFTVVCQLHRGAWRVGVANLTGEKPSQDVWATPGEEPIVRLDLPIAKGGAEARLLGYISGGTGIAIRAEASWIEGEDEPSITLGVVERKDSSGFFFFGDPLDWRRRRHPLPHPIDLML